MIHLKQRGQRSLSKEEVLARCQVVPGVTLYGFCCGYFGRDGYADKLVIEVNGNQIVAVYQNCVLSGATITSFSIDNWVDLVEASNAALSEEE